MIRVVLTVGYYFRVAATDSAQGNREHFFELVKSPMLTSRIVDLGNDTNVIIITKWCISIPQQSVHTYSSRPRGELKNAEKAYIFEA